MFETDTVEDYVDGSFMGTIAEPVGVIIQTHIVTDSIMAVDDYTAALEKCQMELIQYISENTKGVCMYYLLSILQLTFCRLFYRSIYNVGDVAADLIPRLRSQ